MIPRAEEARALRADLEYLGIASLFWVDPLRFDLSQCQRTSGHSWTIDFAVLQGPF